MAPLGVCVRRLIEDDRDERLDVDNGGSLRPERFVVGGLVLVESSKAKASLLYATGFVSATGLFYESGGFSGVGCGGRRRSSGVIVLSHCGRGSATAPG